MNKNLEAVYELGGIRPDKSRVLYNNDYIGEKFDRLLIGPGSPPDAVVHVSKCVFRNCFVAGEFRVAPGVILEDVMFDCVSSPDSFTINTQSVLKNVIVRGAPKSGGLWVKPADFVDANRGRFLQGWVSANSVESECMLDFSEFEAEEVEVIGFPLFRLKWNDERHVPVSLEWKESGGWKDVGLPLTSYWNLCMKRLQSFSEKEGVFALPLKKNRKYAQTLSEMERLIEAGVLGKARTPMNPKTPASATP